MTLKVFITEAVDGVTHRPKSFRRLLRRFHTHPVIVFSLEGLGGVVNMQLLEEDCDIPAWEAWSAGRYGLCWEGGLRVALQGAVFGRAEVDGLVLAVFPPPARTGGQGDTIPEEWEVALSKAEKVRRKLLDAAFSCDFSGVRSLDRLSPVMVFHGWREAMILS